MTRDMARSGTGKARGMAWPSLPRTPIRWKVGAACQEIGPTNKAATSRLQSPASSLDVSTSRTATRGPAPSLTNKLAWFERLIEYAQVLIESGHPVVLAGDYNVVPTDNDIYNPRSWRDNALLQPESRECFRRLVDQGWTDALRAMHGDERIYTYWDYLRRHRGKVFGLRIDHLLVSPALVPRLTAAEVDSWVRDLPNTSDHGPTWIEISSGKKSKLAGV